MHTNSSHGMLPALAPNHDALTDFMLAQRRQVAIWRLTAVTCVVALMVTMMVRHPAMFMVVLFTLLLLAFFLGATLYPFHRGDEEMGIADTSDRSSRTTTPRLHV